MKRGQSEIIGLVVVVLILVFALIFFVKIKNSDDDNESRLIRSNLRANSALNALMKVSLDKKQMKDFVQECINSGYGDSGECDIASGMLNQTIKETIKFDEIEYFSVVKTGNENKLIYSGIDCSRSINAHPFYLRNGGRVEFKICT